MSNNASFDETRAFVRAHARRALIVADEAGLSLQQNLMASGYVTRNSTMAEAARTIRDFVPDVMLIIVIHQAEGETENEAVALARRLRAETSTYSLPLIFLWDEDEPSLQTAAQNIGADDYFSLSTPNAEMLARLDALFWRVEAGRRSVPAVADRRLEIDNFIFILDAVREDVRAGLTGTLALVYAISGRGKAETLDKAVRDATLVKAHGFLKLNLRRMDAVTYYGPTALLVYLQRMETRIAVAALSRLHREFNQEYDDRNIIIGLASFPSDGKDVEDLIEKAEAGAEIARSSSTTKHVIPYEMVAKAAALASSPLAEEEPESEIEEPEVSEPLNDFSVTEAEASHESGRPETAEHEAEELEPEGEDAQAEVPESPETLSSEEETSETESLEPESLETESSESGEPEPESQVDESPESESFEREREDESVLELDSEDPEPESEEISETLLEGHKPEGEELTEEQEEETLEELESESSKAASSEQIDSESAGEDSSETESEDQESGSLESAEAEPEEDLEPVSSEPEVEDASETESEPEPEPEPEGSEPESPEPESPEPEVAEPESSEPESQEPEAAEPESQEIESPEPESDVVPEEIKEEVKAAPPPPPPASLPKKREAKPKSSAPKSAAKPAPLTAEEAAARELERRTSGAVMPRRLLLAISDPVRMTQLNSLIRAAGYEARAAFDGQQVLHLLRIERPDLLLLEYELKGIDGVETIRRLKKQSGGKLPLSVVMVISGGNEGAAREALKLGAHSVHLIPYDPAELLESIRVAGNAE